MYKFAFVFDPQVIRTFEMPKMKLFLGAWQVVEKRKTRKRTRKFFGVVEINGARRSARMDVSL